MNKEYRGDNIYNDFWGKRENTYSAEKLGYTPYFLEFMGMWLKNRRKSENHALDVGCGNGYFSSKLLSFGCTVTGIDISSEAIKIARSRYKNINFVLHNLEDSLPFKNSTFDTVWCSEVLEHLFSPKFVLEEIYRVLKPNGILLCTVPYHGMLKNLGIALFAFERHYNPIYPHIRFFTGRSLKALLDHVGFTVEQARHCGSGLGLRDLLVPTNILMAANKKL